MKSESKRKLAFRLIVSILLFSMLLCIVVSYVGYRQFTSVLERQYNDTAYEVAETAASYIDGDKVNQYLKTGKTDKAYDQTIVRLDKLVKTSKVTFIYVAKVDKSDYKTLTYVYDSIDPSLGFTRYKLGYTAKDIDEQYVDNVKTLATTGERPAKYLYSYSKDSGAHTTAGTAVRNSQGKIVAILGVEKAMTSLEDARQNYVLRVIGIVSLAAILFLILYAIFLNKSIIHPIVVITKEARRFADDNIKDENALTGIKNDDEIGTLARAISKMEIDIEKYIENLTLVTAEKERIGAELNVATQIQADMLPRIFPYMPERTEFNLYATMDPAKEVGGDFYDYFMIDDDHLALVVGDVSGKGVPAALFMVISKTLIKNYTMLGLMPDEVFIRTNNDLCEGNEAELFTTAWLGIYELSTGIIKYSDAGHDLPIIQKADGSLEYIKPERKGFVLAGMEGTKYRLNETKIDVGDMILIYTDGVPEATDSNNKLFGQERLESAITAQKCFEPDKLLEQIRASVDDFVGEAMQFDDITMLAMYRQS